MPVIIKNGRGEYLAERLSVVFDGIPYRWAIQARRAKRFPTRADANRLVDALAREHGTEGMVVEEVEDGD